MKRERRRASMGPQEAAKVGGPATRHSEISSWLKGIEQTLHQMSRELSNVQISSDTALGRNRNIVIHGIPEPFMKDGI